jgi:hypothetical protein
MPWLRRAAATVETKAATIEDSTRRHQFRWRVPTSRTILAACGQDPDDADMH